MTQIPPPIPAYQIDRYAQPHLTPVAIQPRKPFDHRKHVVLDIITAGLWLPFHAIALLWHKCGSQNREIVRYY